MKVLTSLSLVLCLAAPTMAVAETLTVSTAGGDYGAGMKSAMWGPAAKKLGYDVREDSQSDGLAAVRMQVQANAVTTDVIHLGSDEGALAGSLGILEPLDYSVVDGTDLPKGADSKFCYPFSSYGTILAWNTKTYSVNGPKNWVDFWDVKKFPGRRALRANAQAQIEIALLADGVAPGDVYKVLDAPGGLKRAIDKLAALKPNVAIWWTSGAQSAQILKDGEADMVITWNGRAANAIADGAPAAFTFNGSILGTDCLAVPKGAPHAKQAMKLIAGMTVPDAEANLTNFIKYGPVNVKAYEGGLIPADRLPTLATEPKNAVNSVYLNNDWWVKHGDEAQAAFDAMIHN